MQKVWICHHTEHTHRERERTKSGEYNDKLKRPRNKSVRIQSKNKTKKKQKKKLFLNHSSPKEADWEVSSWKNHFTQTHTHTLYTNTDNKTFSIYKV